MAQLIRILENNNVYKLVWKKNSEDDLKGYILFWGSKSGCYENKVDVALENNYILAFMKTGQNYYFAVKAYDSREPYNLSDFSKEVHIFKK